MYVSMDGSRSENHPEIDRALEERVEQLNAEVNAHNEAADAAALKAAHEAKLYLTSIA